MDTHVSPLDCRVVIPDPPAFWGPLLDDMTALLDAGALVEVVRPDGQMGYAPAPALPCPTCSGSGFDWDKDFNLSGLCPDCLGTGIEEQ